MHMACLSPQFTEQPAQLPRGLDGGALQELTWRSRSAPGGLFAAVLGGPVSLEGEADVPFSLATQAASDRAMRTPVASNALDELR
jgi:hypothetical protein